METDKERADRLQGIVDGVASHIRYTNIVRDYAVFTLEYSDRVFRLDGTNVSPMYNALAKLFSARSQPDEPPSPRG